MEAADEIRSVRRGAGITQAELARLSGVRQPNIAAYETGSRVPSGDMLRRLLRAAGPRPSFVLRRHRADVLRIARQHKADNVRVFGSIARGEDSPDSDIDLLVTFEPDASVFDLAELVDQLEDLLGTRVDVVPEDGLGARHTRIRREAVAL